MSSPSFKAPNARTDPYRNYRFRMKWDGNYVAGFTKFNMPARATNVITHRAGGDRGAVPVSPGQTAHDALTLERGITCDAAFEQWASQVWNYRNSTGPTSDVSLGDFRKDITVELYNEAGRKVLGYDVYRCWPSEFTALPVLDGDGNAIAIQTLKLENEGWQRDDGVIEPTGAVFGDPPP
jgi:phage tail-like protein